MTNKELVNKTVCNNCRVCINTGEACNEETKEACFTYSSALQVANEKDRLLAKYVENEVKIINNS